MIVTAVLEMECVQHLKLAIQHLILKVWIRIARNTKQDIKALNGGSQFHTRSKLKSQSFSYPQTIERYICTINNKVSVNI